MDKMKKWTWGALRKVVAKGGVTKTIINAPKKLRHGLAAAFSVLKWEGGVCRAGECGLCVLFNDGCGDNCPKCPLKKKDKACMGGENSLFQKALWDSDRERYAVELYTVLCEIYREEWEKL